MSALVLSLPSVAVAALDLADRLRKRHRSADLIEEARQAQAQQITVRLLTDHGYVQLAALTPDELLDLLDAESPGS